MRYFPTFFFFLVVSSFDLIADPGGTVVHFPDYLPTDPDEYCQRTFECTFGGEGQFTSEIAGPLSVPYTSGPISGVKIVVPVGGEDNLVGIANDGAYLRFISYETLSGDSILFSSDCALTGPPAVLSFSAVYKGMFIGPDPLHVVTP
jgi:hypothetical protein